MDLDAQEIPNLKREFDRFPESALSLTDFVRVVKEHLKGHIRSEAQIVSDLCELFSEIDFNGDGSVEWDEFTTFLIESAKVQHFSVNRIKEYSPIELADRYLDEVVRNVICFDSWDRIVMCGRNKRMTILHPGDLDHPLNVVDHGTAVLNAEYVKPFNYLITAASDMTIRVFDAQTLAMKKSMSETESQTSLRWHPGGRLFSGSRLGSIGIWDLEGVEKIGYLRDGIPSSCEFSPHTDSVMDMCIIDRDDLLATASLDSRILLWDLGKGTISEELKAHTKGVQKLAFSKEFYFVASIGFENEAYVWIPGTRTTPFRLRDSKRPHLSALIGVHAVQNSPQILTADSLGTIKVWDIRNFQCVQTFNADGTLRAEYGSHKSHRGRSGPQAVITTMTYSESLKRIVACGKRMYAFDYESETNPLLAADRPIVEAMFNKETLSFITAAGCDVRLWNGQTGELIQMYTDVTDSEITCMCLDDRRRKFFVGTHDGQLKCFNFANGAFVKEYPRHPSEVSALIYCRRLVRRSGESSHDGDDTAGDSSSSSSPSEPTFVKSLLSICWDGKIRVLDDEIPSEGVVSKVIVPLPTEVIDANRSGVETAAITSRHPSTAGSTSMSTAHTTILTASTGTTTTPTPAPSMTAFATARRCSSSPTKYSNPDLKCIDFSKGLSLFVTAGMDGLISVWDFEAKNRRAVASFFRDEKTDKTYCEGEATCVKFLGREACVLVADSAGHIMCFTFRPHDAGNCLLWRWSNVETFGFHPSVCAMDFDPSTNLLYTGDDHGTVVVWDLTHLIETWRLDPNQRDIYPTIRADGSDSSRKNWKTTVKPWTIDAANISVNVPVVHKFDAHSDSFSSLHLISDPPSLITAGYDCRVRLWSLEGKSLGGLRQKLSDEAEESDPYLFQVDEEKKESAQMSRAQSVLDTIKKKRKVLNAFRAVSSVGSPLSTFMTQQKN
eukprot:TRINITY_DN2443_c0_g2_i3.p1 TRINITY_DN2443_c0_g2~~TRINITY_DN2443_c0_g2_i3.p1  ORF type:complete len:1053 (+),score=260.96 TRINITY_DN2443_c0_g2_i3:311-3160(+)